jgi:hypothetical protein
VAELEPEPDSVVLLNASKQQLGRCRLSLVADLDGLKLEAVEVAHHKVITFDTHDPAGDIAR